MMIRLGVKPKSPDAPPPLSKGCKKLAEVDIVIRVNNIIGY